MTLCDCCMCDLNREENQLSSPDNKMWIGNIPLVLKDLTIPKVRLIPRYRHNNRIIKLTSFSNDANSAQSALKRNVVTFVQHLSHIAKTLPISLNGLYSDIKTVFVGNSGYMYILLVFSFLTVFLLFLLETPDRCIPHIFSFGWCIASSSGLLWYG
jgi:hypothetical protein